MCDALFKIIQTQSEFLANGALAAIKFIDGESIIHAFYVWCCWCGVFFFFKHYGEIFLKFTSSICPIVQKETSG